MADANVRAVITAEDKASSVINGVTKSVDNTALSFGKLAGAVAAGQAAFAAADEILHKVSDILGDVISKGEAYQTATSNLQITINNNTDITDKNIESLLNQADALSKVTQFSDEQYVATDSLLAIHKLTQKQIADLVPHLADMAQGIAAATGEMPNLAAATQLISKAIGENDISGFSGTLRRAGVFLTDYQQSIIQNGTITEKLAVITGVLSDHFKGLSTADTAAIKIGILNNQIDNAEQSIGLALLPTISILADKLAKFVESDQFQAWLKLATQWLQDNLPKAVNWIINTGIPGLVKVFNDAKPILKDVADVIKVMFDPIVVGIKAVDDVGKALDGLKNHKVDASSLLDLTKLVIPKPIKDLAHALHIPGFASGVENFEGGLAYVHQGEVLANLPKGTSVLPKNDVKKALASNQTTINLNVNVGTFVGSEMEKRKLAQELFRAYNDLTSARGMAA